MMPWKPSSSHGFVTSKSDSSLFLFTYGNVKAFFLANVDDPLLTSNHNGFLQAFIIAFSYRFPLKNMGAPHYFLGIEFIPTKSGIFLYQHKYIRDVLENLDMERAKPTPTPLSPSATLQLHDGSPDTNAMTFHQIIRSIRYLNLMHPDLSFSINKFSQYMHKPITLHLQHLKCLPCYLKHTINYDILL